MQKKINWVNTLFLTLIPIIGITGTIILSLYNLIQWQTWILALIMCILSGLSITGGYHRLFAHKTYHAKWPLRLLFVLFGAAAFEGSVLEWSTDHRRHHRDVDTEKDPYNINEGFWYAHIGWLFTLDHTKRDYSNVADLKKDRLIQLQHRYFPLVGAIMGFVFPTAIAALWGNALAGLIVAGALRITITQQGTFCINSICHLWGKRTYTDQQTARDNWITALFTFGEGFHNFHHQFPGDYRNGIRAYHYDPTKWLIKGCSYIKLTSNLKKMSEEHIVRYKIRMQEKNVPQLPHWMQPIRDNILTLAARVEELEKRLQMPDYRQQFTECREHLKQSRRELRKHLAAWKLSFTRPYRAKSRFAKLGYAVE